MSHKGENAVIDNLMLLISVEILSKDWWKGSAISNAYEFLDERRIRGGIFSTTLSPDANLARTSP